MKHNVNSWWCLAFTFSMLALLVQPLFGMQTAGVGQVAQTEIADQAMELSGFSASETFEIEDGSALIPADPKVTRLIYRVGKTSAGNFNQWSKFSAEVTWEELAAKPRSYRFWTFHRRGLLRRVEVYKFGPEFEDELLKGFYVTYCQTDSGNPFVVLTRSTCQNWPLDQIFDSPQPIAFSGFFLGHFKTENTRVKFEHRAKNEFQLNDDESDLDNNQAEPTVPVFVANRLAWYPKEVNPEFKVNASRVALAQAGVDIGQFDFVEKENKHSKPLGAKDSACFFQMIGAAKSIGKNLSAGLSASSDAKAYSTFVDLMQNPSGNIGNAVTLRGRVRQCVPVKIQSADVRKATGLEQYYQVILFPDLDGQQIVVNNLNGEDQVYTSFPVTVCLTELPGELTVDQVEGQQLFLKGFFYRFWSYAAERAQQDGVQAQVSPLVIASQAEVVSSSVQRLNGLLGGLMLAILLGVCLMGWFFIYRSSRVPVRSDALPQSELPEKIDTTNFDLAD